MPGKPNCLKRWHMALIGPILNTIYKGKGDSQDPNNHHGIALKETSTKVLSIILARRLLKRFKKINPSCHIGCQEAQHPIKKALLLRRQHRLESYGIFVYLVKAFDTINHELLYWILLKYGLPPGLVQKVKKLNSNCRVKIKVRSETTGLSYTTGVHQGDNMSPILFLFVMQAFLETLNLKAQPRQFSYFLVNKNGNLHTRKGRLLSQNTKAKGSTFNFSSSFYIDDSYLCFQTKQELQHATTELSAHFARFGLIPETGQNRSLERHPTWQPRPAWRKKSPLHPQVQKPWLRHNSPLKQRCRSWGQN